MELLMIVYKKTNGKAHDLQFKDIPDKDDFILEGDRLPELETLHDPEYITLCAIEKENEAIKKQLEEIDIKSIRSIREWIASHETAPDILKQKEAEAVAAREKLK